MRKHDKREHFGPALRVGEERDEAAQLHVDKAVGVVVEPLDPRVGHVAQLKRAPKPRGKPAKGPLDLVLDTQQ